MEIKVIKNSRGNNDLKSIIVKQNCITIKRNGRIIQTSLIENKNHEKLSNFQKISYDTKKLMELSGLQDIQ